MKQLKDTIKAVLLFSTLPKSEYEDIISRLNKKGISALTSEEKIKIQKRFDLLRKVMGMTSYELF